MRITHTVTAAEDGQILDHLLRGAMGLSRRQALAAKRAGITADGVPVFCNQPARAGQVIAAETAEYDPVPADVSLPAPEVVYEDDTLLAVFKPAPLQCHPSPSVPSGSDTLEARVQAFLRAPAHPVHRLDAETRGLVLFAKEPFAQAFLQKQMAEGAFRKTYRAWLFGSPAKTEGTVSAPIRRETPDSFTRVVSDDGQPAETRWKVLRTVRLFPAGVPPFDACLAELSPFTGRTHQLRVHMTHLGCPLLGDTRYFTEESRIASAALSLPFHQLCACSLRFPHPVTGKEIVLSADAEFDPPLGSL